MNTESSRGSCISHVFLTGEHRGVHAVLSHTYPRPKEERLLMGLDRMKARTSQPRLTRQQITSAASRRASGRAPWTLLRGRMYLDHGRDRLNELFDILLV